MDQIVLTRRPPAIPQPVDFKLVTTAEPECGRGEILLELQWLSIDPYLRSVISGKHLGERLALVQRVPGTVVGRVLESKSGAFAVGDIAVAEAGWSQRAVVAAKAARKLDPKSAPVQSALGVLGMPGLTAWAGIDLAQVAPGDVVLISAAAGAVGGSAGQWAQQRGATVIGIAGGKDKCNLVRNLYGFADCLDYKSAGFGERLAKVCAKGVDVYFDNVGGAVLDQALNHLRQHARIVLCGLIDQYNRPEAPPGPNLGRVIAARATMMGLVVYDHMPRFDAFLAEALPLVASGKMRLAEDVTEGLAHAPEAFCRLMRGQNVGKTLVRL